ncbi:DUF1569 domain-containing protein [Chryseobacterium paridis]|uniref:DUF1569 domain-containing protein n=1 Tax=Chryseobacterium paridis TaxID=2800328 RepID=A0ABS1FW29_9FLAO|nr:DUF1569 domain-containing protein [Chryseobacterium paridis]MBK1896419.1 DUF1569 domain-containing protein [Chryseobacterium paridis]
MKTIFENTTRQELIERINSLTENNKAEWGKMNIYQMTKHCTIWNDWVQGINKEGYKQEFMGKIFGKMALRSLVKGDKPMQKNIPAGNFAIKETEDNLEQQKNIWMKQIAAYGNYSNPDFIHNFFGKMKRDDLGVFVYKHMDHHLRQFDA